MSYLLLFYYVMLEVIFYETELKTNDFPLCKSSQFEQWALMKQD